MPIEVVFIVGDSNSGKSTQVRCLTGKGNDTHRHTDQKNILDLVWINGKPLKGSITNEKTLVMNSSLNEGGNYKSYLPGNHAYQNSDKVHPRDLKYFLDAYDLKGCKKAILCISTSVKSIGWLDLDYKNQILNGFIGKHAVTHCGELGVNGSAIASSAKNVQQFPVSPVSRNQVAVQIRQFIGLV